MSQIASFNGILQETFKLLQILFCICTWNPEQYVECYTLSHGGQRKCLGRFFHYDLQSTGVLHIHEELPTEEMAGECASADKLQALCYEGLQPEEGEQEL